MAQEHSKLKSPIKWQRIDQFIIAVLKKGTKTTHNRIISCGFVVILLYLIPWLGTIWHLTLKGSSITLLNFGFFYLGGEVLWKQRHHLANATVFEDDRLIGYLLILGGAAAFPFCFSSISLQALIVAMVVAGMAISSWGIGTLKNYALSMGLILAAIYPDLLFLANTLRKVLTQDQLECWMAWVGGLALQAIGQTTTVQGTILALAREISADKAVEVASGCSGFDMACTMAGVGLILGLFFKQSPARIGLLAAMGVLLALIFNIPRIMLLAFAVVYWGKASFEFWHGPIGGQIFSTIMLTLYYYLVMALLSKPALKKGGGRKAEG